MLNSEQNLLSGLNARNQEAVREFFCQKFRPLCIYAYSILQNRADAEDIVQEAFLKFIKSKPGFDELSGVYNYLRVVIHNLCMDFLRKKAAQLSHLPKILSLSLKSQEAHNETPAVIESDLLQGVYAAMENLPDRQKEILRLHFIERLSINEIAEKLEISTKTVLNIRQTGVKTLRQALDRKSTIVLLLLQLWILVSNKFRF